MKAQLKQQVLDYESLSVLVCEVESIINGKPITKVSDGPRDFNALKPNHLLVPRLVTAVLLGVLSKEDNYACNRWRQAQYFCDIVW